MKLENNTILQTDAYKVTHWMQYPKKTKYVYSYIESRKPDKVLFFGLQYFLKKYLSGAVIDEWMIDQAEEFLGKVFGENYFNRAGWELILDEYHGKLPLEICAVDEGTLVNGRNVLVTIVNTDPRLPWLTNYFEPLLLKIWYPTTVATNSFNIKHVINKYSKLAGETTSPFHLNDFGFRGVSSNESSGIGGAAHLVNFEGSDTLRGIACAKEYYGGNVSGFSVYASEHSTVTSYGIDAEEVAYRTILQNAPDNATVSMVIDSYDAYNAVRGIIGGTMEQSILSRNGKFVVRPDSGNPVIVCTRILHILWEEFGGTVNPGGFKVLNNKIGVIYGDGVDITKIDEILHTAVREERFAPSNLIFGMGGALLQAPNRDDYGFSYKTSAIMNENSNEWRDVFKRPLTDERKASKKGRLKLKRYGQTFVTERSDNPEDTGILKRVFHNGTLYNVQNLDEIRKRADYFQRNV